MAIDDLIAGIIKREGGYTDNPSDRGGPTNFGITKATAFANGYAGDMRALTAAQAAAIYRSQYWSKPHFDAVALAAQKVAAEMFDTGVNCGPPVAVMMLQRALNAFLGISLKIDGVLSLGGATLNALGDFMRARGSAGEAVLVCALNCLQGERYISLVEQNQSQQAFIYGWMANRVLAPAA